MKKKQMLSNGKEKVPLYIMIAPFTVLFFVFMVLPIFSSIVLSFTSYDTMYKTAFVGLQNYYRMFLEDEVFPIAAKNTVLFAVITGP